MRLMIPAFMAVLAAIGCNKDNPPAKPTTDGSKYLLTAEPSGAKSVKAVREKAKDKDEVVVVGRIGGEKEACSSDSAIFWLVNEREGDDFVACSEVPGDDCKTPWDYCCADPDKLKAGMASIEIVDETGKTVAMDVRKLLGVKELQTVVVKGVARWHGKSLTIEASGVFVRPEKK